MKDKINWLEYRKDLEIAIENEKLWSMGSIGDEYETHIENIERMKEEIDDIENGFYNSVIENHDRDYFSDYLIDTCESKVEDVNIPIQQVGIPFGCDKVEISVNEGCEVKVFGGKAYVVRKSKNKSLSFEEYVNKANTLYRKYVWENKKAKSINVRVSPEWCTVSVCMGIGRMRKDFIFCTKKHLDNGWTNEKEWNKLIDYLNN